MKKPRMLITILLVLISLFLICACKEKIQPPPEDTSTFKFSSSTSFTLATASGAKNWEGSLEYSTDKSAWSEWNGSLINSSADGKLYLRGTGNSAIGGFNKEWVLTGSDISCTGNIENLLDYGTVAEGNHPAMGNNCYHSMFSGCTSLTSAPTLPATTLTNNCYYRMFDGCTSLASAPALPATTLAPGCYNGMFHDCTSLASAPALPATTLAVSCYQRMFEACTSLASVPALPATTLIDCCYQNMFTDCTSIKMSATQTGEYQTEYRIPTTGDSSTSGVGYALDDMFTGTGGTFVQTPVINTVYYTSNTIIQ